MPSLLRATRLTLFCISVCGLRSLSVVALLPHRETYRDPWVFGCQESETEAPSYFDGKYEHRAMFTGISGVTLEARETKTAFAGS